MKRSSTFRLSEETIKQLKELAKIDHRSQADEIEYLVELYYKQMKQKNDTK